MPVTEVEERLLNVLAQLDEAAKGTSAAGSKPDLQSLFARIDDLTGQLPPATDPDLLHFLWRKSYAKALQFLRCQQGQPESTTGG